MKKFTLVPFLFFLILSFNVFAQQADPNNGLRHIMTADEAADSYKIALGFIETSPPPGTIRNVEEFGNNDGVLIRYPFGIPMSLIKELAKDAKVTTVVTNSSQQSTVTSQYLASGVNLDNCNFLITPSDSYWTRDYGPWYVTFGNKEVGIVDFPYNRPRPNDDEIPKVLASSLGIPWFGMNVIHTGGNYMTNGISQASSTTLVWDENLTQTHPQVAQKIHDYLGIDNYMVEQDPNGTYIDHIDCWGKFLAPDKVLIRKVPVTHPQYGEIEATAAFYASQLCSYGTHYKVYRVNTPNDEPYTNSFILKNKVCVPIMGTSNDAAALLAYQQAMPGYQVFGFLGLSGAAAWVSTDALHCRTHEMADLGMLMISHTPLHDTIDAQPCFEVNADITAFSNQLIYPDSVWTIFKVNSGIWDTITMTHLSGERWTACIPGQLEGSTIQYYIHAEDASDRSSNHPYIGAPDAHTFFVRISENPKIVVSPDTLMYNTPEEILNGKTAIIANYSNVGIGINQVENQGANPFAWHIDPWSLILPYTLQPGSSVDLTVKPLLPLPLASTILCDTLQIISGDISYNIMVCINPVLLTENHPSSDISSVRTYPNPTTGSVTFMFENKENASVSIEVYSMTGELVAVPLKQQLSGGSKSIFWDGNTMNGDKLPAGIYFYRISQGNTYKAGKISIVR